MSKLINSDLLSVKQLCWSVNTIKILKNLSFNINQGDFVGIIGPNGSGKSSLLRCLYRKNRPTSGEILLQQQTLARYSRKDLACKIAVVLQESPTQFDLSVIDVIGMGLIPNKPLLSFDSITDRQEILIAAEKVDLLDKLNQSFHSLSGGEKQRTMIARAILQKPQLLLMDEPTNHLDIHHQIEVLQLARSMGITVLVSIHDLNLAASFCDRLILLDQGEIIAQGKPEVVLTEATLDNIFKVKTYVDQQPFNQKIRISFALN